MATVDFIPFAIGGAANVESQSAWIADAVVTNGFSSGILLSAQMNKALRQGTFGTAGLANLMADITNLNIQDNGVVATFVMQLWLALLMSSSFTDVGVANAISISEPSGLTFLAPVKGIKISCQIASTNTGATTLNWMGTGAIAVKTQSGAALSAGALVAGGYYNFIYDGVEWQLIA